MQGLEMQAAVAHVVELLAEVIFDELSLLLSEHMSMCIELARCGL